MELGIIMPVEALGEIQQSGLGSPALAPWNCQSSPVDPGRHSRGLSVEAVNLLDRHTPTRLVIIEHET
jgi:hypothetical protein